MRGDLQKVWVCHQCNALFLFQSDKDDHVVQQKHRHFAVFDLSTGRIQSQSGGTSWIGASP
jgi:hypothetical protein